MCKNFSGPRSAVVGLGVSINELSSFADCLGLSSSADTDEAAKYYGGEVHQEVTSPYLHLALAAEAAG